METGLSHEFRFLDTEGERQELVADIRRVRQAVIQQAESIPSERHYEPRYHGWSLAALLAHLNTIDNLVILGIKLSLLGIRPPVSLNALNAFNDFTAALFRGRIVATTIRGIQRNEARIADLILTLPLDRFTREVYHPPTSRYLTIEQALQQYFLYHWQEHLETMQRDEGIYYEPPTSSTEV